MTLDPIDVVIRELALLERRGYTLTRQERELLEAGRSSMTNVRADARRRRFRVIDGGRERAFVQRASLEPVPPAA